MTPQITKANNDAMAISPLNRVIVMNRLFTRYPLLPILAAGFISAAAAPLPAHAQWSGTAALTSDYVWRGSSQNLGDPAMQASVKYTHGSGLYASVFGSNVKFKPDLGASREFDAALGWTGAIAPDAVLDVSMLRYVYPGTTTNLNWNELNANLTFRDRYWLAIGHSSNAMASRTSGTYAQIGVRHPLNDRVRVEGSIARYQLDSKFARSYTHGTAGLVWSIKGPWEGRVSWHSSDVNAKQLFPGMAGSRTEFALQTSF